MKLKLTFRLWILVIFLILSLISIFGLPPSFFSKGVVVVSVAENSSLFEQGLRAGQVITSIDNQNIDNLEDFTTIISSKFPSQEKVKTIITTKDSEYIAFSESAPELIVSKIPKTNIKLGLDLSGGSRALIRAQDKELTALEVNDLIAVTRNRLNVYGLQDLKILPVSDLAGDHYMLIEIAGATPRDLEELIAKQGKFEAKIGDETVFVGGNKDVTSVCRNDATCSGIESCDQAGDGTFYCNFRFVVYLSEEAAEKHAEITKQLDVNVSSSGGKYLSKPLDLYVDNILVDSLMISEGLKGRVTTQIQIQGSGSGASQEDAYINAKDSMNKLQTILITGSLPFKLEIVKVDTISPLLGKEFSKTILLAGLTALILVSLVIIIRYRNVKAALSLVFISASEIIIILGIASFISWNLDLPSIAGILATIGTGIDQQIIILDESKQGHLLSLKQKLKRAMGIILGAYFTGVVSLIPLMWAGAGLFKGFAITTIIGITSGILITRPAFTDIINKISK